MLANRLEGNTGLDRHGARDALRAATRAVHARLHRHPGFLALVDGTLSLAAYRGLLLRLYGFHRPLEDALLSAPRHWWLRLDPSPRRRAHRLADDLVALGLETGELARIPRAPSPLIRCAAHLFGCPYVREGATLGGRALAPSLDRLLGPGQAGRQFFSGRVDDGALWGEFCATLERTGNRHLPTIVDAACATFAGFEAWLDNAPPPPSETEKPR